MFFSLRFMPQCPPNLLIRKRRRFTDLHFKPESCFLNFKGLYHLKLLMPSYIKDLSCKWYGLYIPVHVIRSDLMKIRILKLLACFLNYLCKWGYVCNRKIGDVKVSSFHRAYSPCLIFPSLFSLISHLLAVGQHFGYLCDVQEGGRVDKLSLYSLWNGISHMVPFPLTEVAWFGVFQVLSLRWFNIGDGAFSWMWALEIPILFEWDKGVFFSYGCSVPSWG